MNWKIFRPKVTPTWVATWIACFAAGWFLYYLPIKLVVAAFITCAIGIAVAFTVIILVGVHARKKYYSQPLVLDGSKSDASQSDGRPGKIIKRRERAMGLSLCEGRLVYSLRFISEGNSIPDGRLAWLPQSIQHLIVNVFNRTACFFTGHQYYLEGIKEVYAEDGSFHCTACCTKLWPGSLQR